MNIQLNKEFFENYGIVSIISILSILYFVFNNYDKSDYIEDFDLFTTLTKDSK